MDALLRGAEFGDLETRPSLFQRRTHGNWQRAEERTSISEIHMQRRWLN